MRNSMIVFTLMAVIAVSAMSMEIDGVMGMTDVENSAAIAVWVTLAHDEAVSGVTWYNNDGTAAFPELLLSAGSGNGPGAVVNATAVYEGLLGGSDTWSSTSLAEPVASAIDGLYVVFRLPQASVQIRRGEGGGAGLGYGSGEEGLLGWMTVDGLEWIQVHEDYGLAVDVTTVSADASTVRLSPSSDKVVVETASPEDAPVLFNAFHAPSPNPFNPQTVLKFSLVRAGNVAMDVFDVRGRRLATLADGEYAAGHHVVEWDGRDGQGRSLSSGVYLIRLAVPGFERTHRVVMVR